MPGGPKVTFQSLELNFIGTSFRDISDSIQGIWHYMLTFVLTASSSSLLPLNCKHKRPIHNQMRWCPITAIMTISSYEVIESQSWLFGNICLFHGQKVYDPRGLV